MRGFSDDFFRSGYIPKSVEIILQPGKHKKLSQIVRNTKKGFGLLEELWIESLEQNEVKNFQTIKIMMALSMPL